MGQEQWAWFGYRTGRDVDSYMNAVEDSLTKKILKERGARMGNAECRNTITPSTGICSKRTRTGESVPQELGEPTCSTGREGNIQEYGRI